MLGIHTLFVLKETIHEVHCCVFRTLTADVQRHAGFLMEQKRTQVLEIHPELGKMTKSLHEICIFQEAGKVFLKTSQMTADLYLQATVSYSCYVTNACD